MLEVEIHAHRIAGAAECLGEPVVNAVRKFAVGIASSVAVVAVLGTVMSGAVQAQESVGTIAGTITDARGVPLRLPGQLRVNVLNESGASEVELGNVSDSGEYRIDGLPAGTYRLEVQDWSYSYLYEYFGGARTIDGAAEVEVIGGQVLSGIDIELDLSIVLAGQFVGAGGVPIDPGSMILVSAYDETGAYVQGRDANDLDYFELGDLPNGRYRLAFHDVGCNYTTSYFDGQGSFVDSELIEVVRGEILDLGEIELPASAGECAPDPLSGPVSVIADGLTLNATWTPPGEVALPQATGYVVTSLPAGAGCTTNGATSCVIQGANAGTDYRFFAAATNAAGTSLPSLPSAIVRRPADPVVVVPSRDLVTKPQTVKRHPSRIGVGRTKALPKRSVAGVKVRWTSLTPRKCVVRKGKLIGRDSGKCKVRAIAKPRGTWLRYEKTTVVRVR